MLHLKQSGHVWAYPDTKAWVMGGVEQSILASLPLTALQVPLKEEDTRICTDWES